MKTWGLFGVLLVNLLTSSCGIENKDNGNSIDDFYNQFITSENGIDNGRDVSAVNFQISSGQTFSGASGADQIINDWKLKLDKDGTFYIFTDVNSVLQGGNDAPLLFGKGGTWSAQDGVLTLDGVGKSQTAALNSMNDKNFFSHDMCTQTQQQSGCMSVFIDQEIELSQSIQGSFSNVTGRMLIPGGTCYQVCRK